MKTSLSRRYRRHNTASRAEGTFFKKESQESFFSGAEHDSFFQPAHIHSPAPVVQRKCEECAKEDKQVQREPEKKEEEKVMKMEDKKEDEKVMKMEDKKEEEKAQRQPGKKEEEKLMKMEDKKEEEKVQREPEKKEEEKEEKVMKMEEKKEEENVQKKETGPSPGSAKSASNFIGTLAGKGQPLPAQANHFFSSRMGYDFSNVKIHTDKDAADSARGINAKAYAIGNNIVFSEGQFNTQSGEGRRLIAHELTHVLQQNYVNRQSISRFPVTAVDKVRSLRVEEAEVDFAGKGATILARDKVVSKRFAERLAEKKTGADEKAAISAIDTRWDALVAIITKAGGSITVSLLQKEFAGIRTSLASDKTDLKKIKNENVKDAVVRFDAVLTEMVSLGEKINDEFYTVGSTATPEFFRFDKEFSDPDTDKIIKTIKGASFTAADVKALIGTETGDLTNTGVAGIKGKTKGLTEFRENKTHIGLGQQTKAAAKEGEAKVAAAGGTLSSAADHRKDPSDSIKLTAGYMARVADLLLSCLPKPVPTGDEFKKLVFAAYNGGHDGVCNAADDFITRNGSKKYDWADIKDFKGAAATKTKKKVNGITEQMRQYVIKTVLRLT